MKDGIFEPHVHQSGEQPRDRPDGNRQHERTIPETRDGQRDDDARERRHRLDGKIDAAEHDHERHAGREDEEHRRVARKLEQRSGLQKYRLSDAHDRDQDHERCEREPLPHAVRSEPLDESVHMPPQTMCAMRSTWLGLWPGLASVANVTSPSRITSTVWLRPIVSSRVSEVRMTATPSAVMARTSS